MNSSSLDLCSASRAGQRNVNGILGLSFVQARHDFRNNIVASANQNLGAYTYTLTPNIVNVIKSCALNGHTQEIHRTQMSKRGKLSCSAYFPSNIKNRCALLLGREFIRDFAARKLASYREVRYR